MKRRKRYWALLSKLNDQVKNDINFYINKLYLPCLKGRFRMYKFLYIKKHRLKSYLVKLRRI